MAEYINIKDLKGKDVVSAVNGEKIASVSDTMIDTQGLRVAGIVVSSGSFLQPRRQVIRGEDVQVWGRDVILVRADNPALDEEVVDEREDWHKTSDYLRSRTVVDIGGRKLGQIDDVLIDTQGRFVGYQVSDSAFGQAFSEPTFIPAEATHAMGEDVLIVDSTRFETEVTSTTIGEEGYVVPPIEEETWQEEPNEPDEPARR